MAKPTVSRSSCVGVSGSGVKLRVRWVRLVKSSRITAQFNTGGKTFKVKCWEGHAQMVCYDVMMEHCHWVECHLCHKLMNASTGQTDQDHWHTIKKTSDTLYTRPQTHHNKDLRNTIPKTLDTPYTRPQKDHNQALRYTTTKTSDIP